ncbi:MAG: phosphotransferase [Propionibacteriaceae bacterium]
MSTPGRNASPDPSREDELLAQTCCSRLGLGPPVNIVRLAGGRSGAPVVAADVDGSRLVLKMTSQPERVTRAELEVRLLRSAGVIEGLAPELVASAVGPGWVAIATRPCTPLGAAPQIDFRTWMAAATRLAEVHRCLPAIDGLLPRPRSESFPGDGAGLAPWFTLGAGDDALRGSQLLAEQPALQLPQVLTHGDCHLDNILHDPSGALVWIDWQEAHLGDGLGDLVFLWQRAEFDGARPPRAEMTRGYARARQLDPGELQPLLDRVELQLLLHSWPPFLSYGTPTARDTMRRRLAALARR